MMNLKNLLSLLVFFMAFGTEGKAQVNLVPNPSFEDYTICPNNLNQISFSKFWNFLDTTYDPLSFVVVPGGAPEYCNECSSSTITAIPDNNNFYHYARTGTAMMQQKSFLDLADSNMYARDYIQGKLTHTLLAGHHYLVSFYGLVEKPASTYFSNNFGAYLDDGTIDTTHNPGWTQVQYTPQIIDTNVLYDTVNWVKISGTFIANGTEKFITIGNFKDRFHTTAIPRIDTSGLSGSWTWNLIDDVSVIDCGNQPQAGVDTIIVPGDSVYIGPHEGLLPYTWYAWGHTSALDSGGGMWVHPDSTTTYILEQNLCGVITYDTITITMSTDTAHHHVGIAPLAAKEGLHLYPNPASNELTISGLGGNTQYRLMDVTGYVVRSGEMHRGVNKLALNGLVSGVYMLDLVGESGERVVRRVVKE